MKSVTGPPDFSEPLLLVVIAILLLLVIALHIR
jgi:hypothetical protein